MLPIFCLRLAAGMICCLAILSPAHVNPKFYRTHFLTALGLALTAAVFLYGASTLRMRETLIAAIALCLLGSIVWTIENAPGGVMVIPLAAIALVGALLFARHHMVGETWGLEAVADDLTSSLLLGGALTAMLMGHSYLIAPTMSLSPLMRLLACLAIAILLRIIVAGWGLGSWTKVHSLAMVRDETLFLPLRWLLGFVGPLVLTYLAWQTAKIRSTQSATGILYVVVIFCFLGELVSQVLHQMTGYTL